MITKRIIKTMVELYSGIDDISIRSRKLFITDNRSVYYKLCRTFSLEGSNSYSEIGKLLNRNHATVIHGLRSFNDVHNSKLFTASDIYNKCYEKLCTMVDNERDIHELLDGVDLRQYYRIKHIMLTEKSHKVISLMQRKIDVLTTNELVKKILTLNAQDIEELEQKFDVFFKVKSKLNENKIQKVQDL